MIPIITGILGALLQNNLPKIAQSVVDKGLDYVEGKLGIKLEPDMTPEQVLAIKVEAQKHEEFLIKEDNANTSNARSLQVSALSQEDVFSKRFIYYLATFWSVVSSVYIGCATFVPIPKGNERVLDTCLGFLLGTIIATITNYFYGTSSSSEAKTRLLFKGKDNDL